MKALRPPGISGREPPSRHDTEDVRPQEGRRHLRGGGRDALVARRAHRDALDLFMFCSCSALKIMLVHVFSRSHL